MIKAVLFDLDGTLVDSLCDLADATNYALNQNGYPAHETEAFKYFVGDGMPKLIERALPPSARDEENIKRVLSQFLKYYAVHYVDKTCVYDGIYGLVDSLKKSGMLMAVVTNKKQEMAQMVVNKLFGDAFDFVLGKCEGIPAKPDPASAFIAMEKLGVKPMECIFIGDSGMDIATAVNCGAVPVGVLWGFRTQDELSEHGAQFIIDTPCKLLDIIEDLKK